MTTKDEALKLALEYLRDNQHYIADNERHAYVMEYNAFVDRLEALAAQPVQQQNLQDLWHKVWPDAGAFVRASADDLTQFAKAISTSPQPAQPSKPLTDEQIENLWQNTSPYYDHQDFARSIEAAHGIMSGTDGKGDA